MSKFLTRAQLALLEPRTIRVIAWFVTCGALLYLAAVLWSGWHETATAFAALGPQALLFGTLLSSSSYLWRFIRWEHSLECFGSSVPRLAHFGIYLSGLALTATPGKAGETFRSALLLHHGVEVTHSLAAFFVDRGSDVLGIILLGTLAAAVLGQQFAWAWLLLFALVLLGSMSFAHLLSHSVAGAGCRRPGRSITWLPIKYGQATLEAWAKVWTPARASAFSAVAMLAYGTQALVFSWFCYILELGIPIADCVLIFVQATLFGAATMIPGGLGAMEAALFFQLLERGASEGSAMSLTIAIRMVTFWFAMLSGVVSLLISGSMPYRGRLE